MSGRSSTSPIEIPTSPGEICRPPPVSLNDLPYEIRKMIWEIAIEDIGPRVVHLRESAAKHDFNDYARVRSDCQPPSDILMFPVDLKYFKVTREKYRSLAKKVASRRLTVEFCLDASGDLPWGVDSWFDQYLFKMDHYVMAFDGPPPSTIPQNGMKIKGRGGHIGDIVSFTPGSSTTSNDLAPFEAIECSYKATYLDQTAVALEFPTVRCRTPEVIRGFRSTLPIPALLLACKESHQLAAQRYQRAFATLGCRAEIYFDFDRDILYLDNNSIIPRINSEDSAWDSLWRISHEDRERVRHLALQPQRIPSYDSSSYSENTERDWVFKTVILFGRVQTLFVESHTMHYRRSKRIPGNLLDCVDEKCSKLNAPLVLRDFSTVSHALDNVVGKAYYHKGEMLELEYIREQYEYLKAENSDEDFLLPRLSIVQGMILPSKIAQLLSIEGSQYEVQYSAL